jgi:hypothetical protein
MMPKFRRRPALVEAFQMNKDAMWSVERWPVWLMEALRKKDGVAGAVRVGPPSEPGTSRSLFIYTPEGVAEAREDDWVIQGVDGELYTCAPDTFAAIYEEVT